MASDLAFVLCVESGRLEPMSIMLVESIRTFAGDLRGSPIWVVTPRGTDPLGAETQRRLSENDVIHVRGNINRHWPSYGLANKPYAAAFVEGLVGSDIETLCLLDTDTLVLRPPTRLRIPSDEAVAVAPVAKVNVGLAAGQPLDEFWKVIVDACGAPREETWSVEPRVGAPRLRPYFNSGLVATRVDRNLFRHWADSVTRLSRDPRIPGLTDRQRYFLEQASLAGIILARCEPDQVRILEKQYNYLLASHRLIAEHNRVERLDDLVHVHYTDAFSTWEWEDAIPIGDELLNWLRPRLPLAPPGGRLKQRILAGAARLLGRPRTRAIVEGLRRLRR